MGREAEMLLERFEGKEIKGDLDTRENKVTDFAFVIRLAITVIFIIFFLMYGAM